MQAGDWVNLAAAVSAGLAVLLPVVFRRLERTDRLVRIAHLYNLLKTQAELKILLDADDGSLRDTATGKQAAALLETLIRQDSAPGSTFRYGLFLSLASLEAFLFLGVLFGAFSDFLMRVLQGRSDESGVYFFEGIFASAASRISLLVICIGLSAGFTLKYASRYLKGNASHYGHTLLLLAVFNAVFVVNLVIVALGLMLLDPIVTFW